jgi:hypothetical protein
MAGLPFVSLAPNSNQDILQQHEQFLSNLRGPGPRRSWIEPNWDMPQTQQSLPDPVSYHTSQAKAELDFINSTFDNQQAGLEKSIAPALEAEDFSYQTDLGLLDRQTGLDPQQKEQKRREQEAEHEKKVFSLRAKIKSDTEAGLQARREAILQAGFKQSRVQGQLEQIEAYGAKNGWTREQINREKLQTLGVAVPQGEEKLPPQEIARRKYVQTKQILDDTVGELLNYRRDPKTGEWQYLDKDGQAAGIVPKDHQSAIDDLEARRQMLVSQAETLFWQWAGSKRPPSLSTEAAKVMSPIGQSIVGRIGSRLSRGFQASAGSTPFTSKLSGSGMVTSPLGVATKKTLTRDQVVALKNQGMTADQVRQWATENGYAF